MSLQLFVLRVEAPEAVSYASVQYLNTDFTPAVIPTFQPQGLIAFKHPSKSLSPRRLESTFAHSGKKSIRKRPAFFGLVALRIRSCYSHVYGFL